MNVDLTAGDDLLPGTLDGFDLTVGGGAVGLFVAGLVVLALHRRPGGILAVAAFLALVLLVLYIVKPEGG